MKKDKMRILEPQFIIIKSEKDVFTLDYLKTYLRISDNVADNILPGLVYGAIEYVENFTNNHFVKKHIMLTIDQAEKWVRVPISPVLKMCNVFVLHNNESQEENVKLITVDNETNIFCLDDQLFNKSLKINYVAGCEIENIPEQIKSAMLMYILDFYDYKQLSRSTEKKIKSICSSYKKFLL